MSEKENQKKGGGKYFAGGAVTGAAVMVAIYLALTNLFDGFGGIGLGGKNPGVSSDASGTQSSVSQTEPAQTTPAEEVESTPQETEGAESAAKVIVIEVSGETVSVNGESFSDAASVKSYLVTQNTDGATYILRDNRAVKSLYDDVEQVLSELSYEYVSETV